MGQKAQIQMKNKGRPSKLQIENSCRFREDETESQCNKKDLILATGAAV